MGLEEKIPDSIALTTLEKMVGWARKRSMWPLGFGLACCAIEMMSTFMSHYDLARFGMEVMRPSPRQADLMIVSGRGSTKMAPVLKRIYDQMPEPKWVISMGACASVGGPFNTYGVLQGVDKIVPRPKRNVWSIAKKSKPKSRDETQASGDSPGTLTNKGAS